MKNFLKAVLKTLGKFIVIWSAICWIFIGAPLAWKEQVDNATIEDNERWSISENYWWALPWLAKRVIPIWIEMINGI